jgi:hypothetical protein
MRQRVPGCSGACTIRKASALLRCFVAVAATTPIAGCGGGLPLLHPAQTLPQGEVRVAAGLSGNVATGGLASALNGARDQAATGTVQPASAPYARGALVAASVAPGLAPYAAARVGAGWNFEGGVAYTGRGLRADVRRSFDLNTHWALSAGVGGSAALYGHQDGGNLPDVDLGSVHGWGADVPVLLGYASDGQLYMAWLGLRGGWEHVDLGSLSSAPAAESPGASGTPTPISLSATRFWGGGLFGIAVGFRHIHVAIELDASYANIAGQFAGTHISVGGVTLAPSTALWWRF